MADVTPEIKTCERANFTHSPFGTGRSDAKGVRVTLWSQLPLGLPSDLRRQGQDHLQTGSNNDSSVRSGATISATWKFIEDERRALKQGGTALCMTSVQFVSVRKSPGLKPPHHIEPGLCQETCHSPGLG
jgi:hypothetical protein